MRRRKRHPEIAMDDYLPQFREDGHHLVRPVVDWSSDLEQGLAEAQIQHLLRQAIELLPPLDKAVPEEGVTRLWQSPQSSREPASG